jgi:redox-sensitive bicupin YhaK (pirin superfamily)
VGEPFLSPQDHSATLPRGQAADIPVIKEDDGTHVRVVCGNFWGTTGPVDGIAADPVCFDVSLPPGAHLPIGTTHRALAYVFAGSCKFCDASDTLAAPTEGVGWAETGGLSAAENRSLGVFDCRDEVNVLTGDDGIRCLLVAVQPLEDPVAWYGPMVMNTQGRLREALDEQRGACLKR